MNQSSSEGYVKKKGNMCGKNQRCVTNYTTKHTIISILFSHFNVCKHNAVLNVYKIIKFYYLF